MTNHPQKFIDDHEAEVSVYKAKQKLKEETEVAIDGSKLRTKIQRC